VEELPPAGHHPPRRPNRQSLCFRPLAVR
jgi:hypothetical protein